VKTDVKTKANNLLNGLLNKKKKEAPKTETPQ
jgi:hypothetical protein